VAGLPVARTRPSPLNRGERRVGLLFVLPALALFALFVGWPILHSVYISTTTWSGFGVPRFTGLDNYVRMAGDPVFRTALAITVGFTAVTTVLQTALPMLVAILVNAGWRRAGIVIRTILFLPAIISLVVTGVLWQLIYDPNLGTLNQLLADVGLESWRQQWLGDPNLVLPSLIVVSLWQSLGLYMLIFFAGLQGIDPTLYEAATVDGANARQRLWHVTVPQLRTVTGVVVALNLINGFKTFDLVYVMTEGGPNHASEVLGTYLYSLAFGSISGSVPQMGYATAISIVVMLLCLAAAVVQFAVNRRAADVH
jgi:multiple sugar transport system permease protein/raffinose/stachyose/melibiose transport system permease protein